MNWFNTYQKFIAGDCGKPKRKKKTDGGSIHLTNELFRFERCEDGVTRLFIGAKKNNIGYLVIKNHRTYAEPKSIYIKKRHGRYSVSFCYEDGLAEDDILEQKEHLGYLAKMSRAYLEKHVVGIDRGVARPVQAGDQAFDFTSEQKRSKAATEKYLKKYQRRLARQKKGSKHRYRTKIKISRSHEKVANIRRDFCHKASHTIVSNKDAKVLVFEDLKTKNMTAKPKAKPTESGWERNGASAKAGLNKAILDKGWHIIEGFAKYKAYRAGKAFFKVSAYQTSQECAPCGHTHPDNRKSQALFQCVSCGHTDNADRNAAEVIKMRAIELILNPGVGLSKRGVLSLDSGRGATSKTGRATANPAGGYEASKKKAKAA